MPTNNETYDDLTITLTDGEEHHYGPDDWDDYTVCLAATVPCVVVKMLGAWIGVFPLHTVRSVVME